MPKPSMLTVWLGMGGVYAATWSGEWGAAAAAGALAVLGLLLIDFDEVD